LEVLETVEEADSSTTLAASSDDDPFGDLMALADRRRRSSGEFRRSASKADAIVNAYFEYAATRQRSKTPGNEFNFWLKERLVNCSSIVQNIACR
jgi:hypothetical protein